MLPDTPKYLVVRSLIAICREVDLNANGQTQPRKVRRNIISSLSVDLTDRLPTLVLTFAVLLAW